MKRLKGIKIDHWAKKCYNSHVTEISTFKFPFAAITAKGFQSRFPPIRDWTPFAVLR